MLFTAIRFVTWVVLSVCAILVIWHSKIRRKWQVSIVSVAVCAVVVSLTAIYPVENIFITYQSPESVFQYTNGGQIEDVLDGQDSCLVAYSKGEGEVGEYIVPKSAVGYQIPTYRAAKKVVQKIDNVGIFDVYTVRGTSDYYISGLVHLNDTDNEIEVLNGQGNVVDTPIVRVGNTDFIYIYLPDFSNEYCLSVNGEIVRIREK